MKNLQISAMQETAYYYKLPPKNLSAARITTVEFNHGFVLNFRLKISQAVDADRVSKE